LYQPCNSLYNILGLDLGESMGFWGYEGIGEGVVVIVKVKYCGGCNAGYDRTALVRRIQEAFPSIDFVYTATQKDESQGNEFQGNRQDFALIVCGCPVRCADYKDFQGSLGRSVVASQNDLASACQEIEKTLHSL
jgi:hypothetical protein